MTTKLIYLFYLFHCLEFFTFSLVLDLFTAQKELSALEFLLLLFLEADDFGIEFVEDDWELGVCFVYQVGEICLGFIVDSFEEHYGLEVILEIFEIIVRKLFLNNLEDIMTLLIFNFFS